MSFDPGAVAAANAAWRKKTADDAASADQAQQDSRAAVATNAQTQPGVNAAQTALQHVTDPNRYAMANQARGQQANVANYYQGLLSGQNPSLAGMQRQQGQDAAIAALQSQALSNQGGNAPGLSQRNLLNAQATLQGNLTNTAQQNAIQEERSALDASNNAASNMRGMDIGQAQGAGQQELAGAGQYAGLLQNNASRSLADQAQINQNRQFGQQIGLQGQQLDFAKQQAAQQQQNWQSQWDEQNSWWNKYALPGLSAGATLGAAALGGPLGGALMGSAASAAENASSPGSNGVDQLPYQRPGVYAGPASGGR